jgi:extradiol dioxygenase family protein
MKQFYLLATLLMTCVYSYCQDLTPNFIALSVKNIDTTQKWYCDNLGFTVKKPVANVGTGVRYELLSGNGMLIELIENAKAARPESVDALPHGIFKFGFRVNDLDKLVRMLSSKAISPKYGPYKSTVTDPANFIVEDPEGNLIQFFEIR